MTAPDLDAWLPEPALRVSHRRPSRASPDELWAAATQVRLNDTGLLGRLVGDEGFDALFREPPFTVLQDDERTLVSGLVGRIWTLRRDYPQLKGPGEFRAWS